MNSSMNERIESMIDQMTLEEKAGMLHGNGLFKTAGVERLGIPPLKMSDGPMGVRNEFENDTWKEKGLSDDYVTYIPSNSALSATWNRKLAYESGQVLGAEARGRGKDVILAPGINIKRSPLCGRNFEYMSEDPYLTKEFAVPFIKGVQEFDVAACVKHFALNNQETNRLWVDVEIDERVLRELYLPAFKAAVQEAQSYSIMGAYNLVRGEHSCQSKSLLSGLLRDEWKYDGCVISDWGGVHDTKQAAMSGLDIEMSVTDNFDEYCLADPLIEAVKSGAIEEAYVDEKIRNILRMMFRLNIFSEERNPGAYNAPAHRENVLNTAREAVVLLKNEDKVLPIDEKNAENILVIGDNGERMHANGGGSAEIKALYEISPLMGLKMACGGNTDISYVRGYYVEEKKEDDVNWQEASLGELAEKAERVDEAILQRRKELRDEAVALAQKADKVIIVGGLNHDHDVEGWDRKDIKLPYGQDELIREVLAVKPDAVVVMIAGSPVGMKAWIDQAKAVVFQSYSGMEGGTALAEVLLGRINPSGKLTETFPAVIQDCPATSIGQFPQRDHAVYKEGMMVGYRYYDTKNVEPQFCFGHGLSYTQFKYKNMEVQGENPAMTVTVEVTNAGSLAGKEVVQVYAAAQNRDADEPVQQLKGFEKVDLEAGETKKIIITLDKDAFSYYDTEAKAFAAASGKYEIRVGASSRDIRLKQTVDV